MYQMKTLSERKVSLKEAREFYHQVLVSPQYAGIENAGAKSIAKAISLFEGNGRGSQLESSMPHWRWWLEQTLLAHFLCSERVRIRGLFFLINEV